MALTQIDPGAAPNDNTGTPLRTGAGYINAIIDEMWDTITGGIAYTGDTISINSKKTVTKTSVDAGGLLIFPTAFGDAIPQTGMLYVTESGVGKYLIATIFKQNIATTPVVTVLSSNVHAIGAVLADGTIPITGFTTSGNVKMKIHIEES